MKRQEIAWKNSDGQIFVKGPAFRSYILNANGGIEVDFWEKHGAYSDVPAKRALDKFKRGGRCVATAVYDGSGHSPAWTKFKGNAATVAAIREVILCS